MQEKTEQDYLRAIYNSYEQLEDKKKGVRSVSISRLLEVSKPSVSAMLRKLANKRYIAMKPYSNIFLTNKGMEEAKRITRNHRVIEVFLTKIIGCHIDMMTDEAHKLEHAFSQATIDKLNSILNSPKRCPHGKKIKYYRK
jgi:DtxR family transcriptional regulator, Mn-dependent transcriptional regulator